PPARSLVLDLFDTEPYETVVDQHLVSGPEDFPDHRRRQRQLAVLRRVRIDDGHLTSGRKRQRLDQRADADLRPLQVGDDRQRPTALLLQLADELRPGGM